MANTLTKHHSPGGEPVEIHSWWSLQPSLLAAEHWPRAYDGMDLSSSVRDPKAGVYKGLLWLLWCDFFECSSKWHQTFGVLLGFSRHCEPFFLRVKESLLDREFFRRQFGVRKWATGWETLLSFITLSPNSGLCGLVSPSPSLWQHVKVGFSSPGHPRLRFLLNSS